MRHLICILAILATACGGNGGGPSAPSPQIPNVVGSYTGSATLTLPELQESVTCPASTNVTQSNSTVSVAPIILGGQCGNLSVPIGQASIDNTGAFIGSTTGTFNDPSCGTYNYGGSGGFFGREFRLSVSATSATCYNFNFTMVLSR